VGHTVRAVSTRLDPVSTTARRIRDVFALVTMLAGIALMMGAAVLIDVRLAILLSGVLAFAGGTVVAVDRSDDI